MSNGTQKFDVVIIGGGPAGVTAATTAAECGKKVAVVDAHHELGGAGINTGTVPSKTLRETALALSGIKSRNLYGVDLSLRREVTVSDFLGHEEQIRSAFSSMLSHRLETNKAVVFQGTAVFVDPRTLKVSLLAEGDQAPQEVTLTGGIVLIATGSSPVRPPLFPFGKGEIYDSDSILRLDRIPKTMAVIGAGVIGAEYASTFAALGAKVHIIDGRDQLLPFLDTEISAALLAAMERSDIAFHWKESVKKCDVQDSGSVTLEFESGKSMTIDAVLVAAGRKSNTDKLNLDAAGVKTGDRGLIPVDENYRTNVDHIYAAGDVIGFPALASTSMEQARRAIRHGLQLKASQLSPLLPNGIYTIPEVSMVGDTEASLKKKGIDYVVGRALYNDNARGRIIGDQDGILKLIFRRDNLKLAGVHVMGDQATDIVHVGLMAMLTDSTAELFVEACFNVPTLCYMYKAATLDALRQIEAQPGAKAA